MKICHLTSAHPSTDVRIFKKECTSLANAGHEVFLVAKGESRIENNVSVIGIGTEQESRIKRILSTTREVYLKGAFLDADVYHLHDPELLLYVNKLLKRGKIVIFDSHEDVISCIKEKEYIPRFLRNIIAFIYGRFEKNVLKKCNAVITVTPHLRDKMEMVNEQTYMITNYPIFENMENSNMDIKNKVCFMGGISSQWQHEVILDAIRDINVEYVLGGSITEGYLNILKQHPSWRKVTYLGMVPHNEVSSILSTSLCGIAVLDYKLNAGGKIGTLGNTKIFEYMMAAIPIICTDFDLWKAIVEKNECGIVVNAHDKIAIKKAIEFYLDNPDIAYKHGQNGMQIVEKEYNWKSQERVLFDLYNAIESERV